MWSIWLPVILFGAVHAKISDGFGYELIISTLESMENNVRSLEHNLKSIGTKVDQLSAQLDGYTKTATAENTNQCKDVPVDESRCPENGYIGVFQLKPRYSEPFEVYCENGWIVIHRRFDGSVDFNRKWVPYREGFGSLQGEHWLGLEKMHQITRVGSYELLVVLKTADDVVLTAKYEGFKIGSKSEQYQLEYARFSGGDAGDILRNQYRKKFSAHEHQKLWSCYKSTKSGWWFSSCNDTNLNKPYWNGKINYHHQEPKFLIEARMLIRAVKPN